MVRPIVELVIMYTTKTKTNKNIITLKHIISRYAGICIVERVAIASQLMQVPACFYKKQGVRGSGSTFLRIPEFESQKFLKFIKFQHLVS